MKTAFPLAKNLLLTIALLLGISNASKANTYTALTSGNWSNPDTWGEAAPGFDITQNSNIIIPPGITITLDSGLIINNPLALLTVQGALTGGSTTVIVTAGTLTGTGVVTVAGLTVGASGYVTSSGNISVNTLTNSQPVLVLGGTMNVSNSVVLNPGTVKLDPGSFFNLGDSATVNMAGGAISANGGSFNIAGVYNLLYSGQVSAVGPEACLPGLQNVTVALASPTGNLGLTVNLAMAGMLTLQQGVLNLNSHSLTVSGGINVTTGSIAGNAGSNITINGAGSGAALALFANGQTLNNLTINTDTGGSVSLASDITVAGALALTGGALNLNGYNLTIDGTVRATGTGCINGNLNSTITINGAGLADTLMFSAAGIALGGLTVNTGSTGSVVLASDMDIAETLTLSSGSLNLNGQNLIIRGMVLSSGSGSIGGNANSNLTFDGFGGVGTVAFTPGSQLIHNLGVNIGSNGGVFIASPLTVTGTLSLAHGMLGLGNYDLTIAGTGNVTGGSTDGYVVTNGTGGLAVNIANAGGGAAFPVGTQANFAPVVIVNNSATPGYFTVYAMQGVFTKGVSGADISTSQSVVNTSWMVSSAITTGASYNLEVQWNEAMQVNGFNNTWAYISQYIDTAWDKNSPIPATANDDGSFTMMLTGVSSFGPCAVFNENTVTTGIQAVSPLALDFDIYPNPAADYINVSLAVANKYPLLKIYDAIGNEVISEQLTNAITTLPITTLSPGVYFASLDNGVTKTFIKK